MVKPVQMGVPPGEVRLGRPRGTLNHTELTVAALRARGIEPDGLVIGAWPAGPDLASQGNLEDLPPLTGVPLLAVITAGVGAFDQAAFTAAVPGWFTA